MHAVPDATLDADIAVIGKKGRGKTYVAKGLVERLLDLGRRVVVLDPLSTWWGLKARADGREGYPIVVFGGPHGDIALDDGMGRALGRYLAAGEMSAVIDLGLMRKAEQARVVADMLEEMFSKNRDPLWLVLEEADAFAPQSPMGDGNTRVLGEVDRIARRGRAFGFRLISITQRPAKINKDVLTQLSTLLALGVTSPQDRDAIKSWVEGNADRDQAKEVFQSLASLRVGEGWVWAPDLDLLKRVKFPAIKTLDTSATPQSGVKRIEPKRLARADLTKIEAELQKASKDAAATPGKTIKIAAAAAADLEAAEHRGYTRGRADGEATAKRTIGELLARVQGVIDGFAVHDVSAPVPVQLESRDAPSKNRKPVAVARAAATSRPTVAKASPGDKSLSGPERKLLSALAWWSAMKQECPSRAMVGAVAGWRVTSGHLKNVSGSLSGKGLIRYPVPGRLALTEEGRRAAPSPAGGDLHDLVRAILTGPQRQAFEALMAGGKVMSRDELCEAVGWNLTSGHPKNVLGSLSSMELITYPTPGHVQLVDWLS
jgi:uncharacterized protein